MGKICENGQKVYAAYQVAKLLKIYEDCSPNGFYQRWKQLCFKKQFPAIFSPAGTPEFN